MEDNVPQEVKLQRLQELTHAFHAGALANNQARYGE